VHLNKKSCRGKQGIRKEEMRGIACGFDKVEDSLGECLKYPEFIEWLELGIKASALSALEFIAYLELWSRFTPPFIKKTEYINSRHSSALYELKTLSPNLFAVFLRGRYLWLYTNRGTGMKQSCIRRCKACRPA
jgi:hypothetical protein